MSGAESRSDLYHGHNPLHRPFIAKGQTQTRETTEQFAMGREKRGDALPEWGLAPEAKKDGPVSGRDASRQGPLAPTRGQLHVLSGEEGHSLGGPAGKLGQARRPLTSGVALGSWDATASRMAASISGDFCLPWSNDTHVM